MNEVEEQLVFNSSIRFGKIFYWRRLTQIEFDWNLQFFVTACRRGIRPAMAIGGSEMSLKKMEN